MPSVYAYPLAAPADRLRIWVGVLGAIGPTALAFKLDGNPSTPTPLRGLASARSGALLDAADRTTSRAYTGVFEFGGLAPGTFHTVTVSAGAAEVPVRTWTLPAALPRVPDQPFNVLLCSCYDQDEDRSGLVNDVVSQIKLQPALTLFLGDQVYLDLPTLTDYPSEPIALARIFEGKYVANWAAAKLGSPGLTGVLSRAPAAFIPDDHEYWNNFPHPSAGVQNSWTQSGREAWTPAARALYQAFQLTPDTTLEGTQIIEVPPLSIFLADARSERDPERAFCLTEATRERFKQWVSSLIARKRRGQPWFGMLVSGQPLLEEPAGAVRGRVFDFHLPDYGDYGEIVGEVERLAAAGLPLVYVTGDVHYGRVCDSLDPASGRTVVYELISSPAALVTTIGVDQLKRVGGALAGIFGPKDPWPRHTDPEPPPARFGTRLRPRLIRGQKGDHVAMLSLWSAGGGLDMALTYYPIHPDRALQKSIRLNGFKLRAL